MCHEQSIANCGKETLTARVLFCGALEKVEQVGMRLDGKRIVFRADGGFDRGIGHLMRCLALADAIAAIGGKVTLASRALPQAIEAQYRSRGFDILHLSGPSDAASIRALGGDCLVFDSYDIDANARAALAQGISKTAIIDDVYDNGPYDTDLLINPNPGAQAARYGQPMATQKQAMGADYVLLRRDILQAKKDHRVSAAQNILISCGGSDPSGAAAKVLEALRGYCDARLQIKILVGPEARMGSLDGMRASSAHTLEFLAPNDHIQELFNWADIAILAAGTSQWEAAYLGCPFIALIVADNQVPGTLHVAQAGGSVALDWRKSQDADALLKGVCALMRSADQRAAMAVTAQALIDGEGAARLAECLAQIV